MSSSDCDGQVSVCVVAGDAGWLAAAAAIVAAAIRLPMTGELALSE